MEHVSTKHYIPSGLQPPFTIATVTHMAEVEETDSHCSKQICYVHWMSHARMVFLRHTTMIIAKELETSLEIRLSTVA
jgi:hypothetical protein